MLKKTKQSSGADETTPSVPEYFSWISSTNEGSCEAQTMANLDYFAFMKERFGMQLGIYAWDAGNLDGSRGTYETLDSPKIRAQYPNGFAPIAEKAAKAGIRMGLWGGADGFGETEEDAKKRQEQMVSLCRDLHFGLFKFDTVCSDLRAEKRHYFVEMIQKCREYCPDLIVLNHRNDLGDAEIIATTFLWEGLETYTDINISNPCTAMHNRAGGMMRGNVPQLQRLTEDHGVCISSSPDYFEDELILQAFGRCLILAPEIYGNPWFLSDWEQAHLARIYTLHRKFAPILVHGKELPLYSGYGSVSRGNGKTRFLVAGHCAWESRSVKFRLNEEIGLEHTDQVVLIQHHPFEKYLGTYDWDSVVDLEIMPFRSLLVEASAPENASWYLTNCTYEVVSEKENAPVEVKIIAATGEISAQGKEIKGLPAQLESFDHTLRVPGLMGFLNRQEGVPENAEQLYESTMFRVDNDSLEAQFVRRSGATQYEAVQAARDAFFAQKTYLARGCEAKAVFDGREDTFFDGGSKKMYNRGSRVNGGCLRLNLGEVRDADSLTITYFAIDEGIHEVDRQCAPDTATVSNDLLHWETAPLAGDIALQKCSSPVVMESVHNIVECSGKKMRATYHLPAHIRYFRLPLPMDRIYEIRLWNNGNNVTPPADQMHLNNLMSAYGEAWCAKEHHTGKFHIPAKLVPGSFLAIALEGETGKEGAYVTLECEGKLYGCNRRAVAYPVNMWECPASSRDRNLTYFLDLPEELYGRDVTVHALFNENRPNTRGDVYLCHPNREIEGIFVTLL